MEKYLVSFMLESWRDEEKFYIRSNSLVNAFEIFCYTYGVYDTYEKIIVEIEEVH